MRMVAYIQVLQMAGQVNAAIAFTKSLPHTDWKLIEDSGVFGRGARIEITVCASEEAEAVGFYKV